MALAASTMIAPALPRISADLQIVNSAATQLSMSAFILCYGIGALFWAPLAEDWGRKPVMLVSNAAFLAFNIGCGFVETETQLIVARWIAGFGASATTAVRINNTLRLSRFASLTCSMHMSDHRRHAN